MNLKKRESSETASCSDQGNVDQHFLGGNIGDFDTTHALSHLEDFTAWCRQVVERYKGNERAVEMLDAQMQDIMHYIELSENLGGVDGYRSYCLLRDVRRERRKCKSENDLLRPLYEYLSDRVVMNQLAQVLGKIRSANETISKRQYVLRTDVTGSLRKNKS